MFINARSTKMNTSEQLGYALFSKERDHIKSRLGNEAWVTAYDYSSNSQQTTAWYCGLIRNEDVPKALANTSWDLTIGRGFPGCSISGFESNKTITYSRFGFEDAEPLVFHRNYIGSRESNNEISEEFRFFHNLYFESKRNEYVKLDESGDETTIIRFEAGKVLIRLKEIRQFLAIKDMHLALFFDHVRHSDIDVSNISENLREELYSDKHTVYQFRIKENVFVTSDLTTGSILFGKKMIEPFPKSKSDFWPYNEDEKEHFDEFIINETSDGDLITYTCNHEKLANYFGANPEAPHYLTPVYFKREVLLKYYNNPERFSVEDSYLRCGNHWGLSMDNHHEDVVVVYLGDIGRDLPAKERAYWKSFNIAPIRKLSKTKFIRDFLAQPCDPEGKDLIFKHQYSQLNQNWNQKYGWPLFLSLKEKDVHFFQNLRVLLNNSQNEFDSQVLALAKILVDALNEAEIEKHISAIPDPQRGIAKFKIFLDEHDFKDINKGIDLLKLIQGLRSTGVAHLKGGNYDKLTKNLGLADKELISFFSELLSKATDFMELLIKQTEAI